MKQSNFGVMILAAGALATFAHPSHIVCYAPGDDEGHPCPSPEAAFGCANSFPTNLSLTCRLPATRII
ncbi:hypothetical protein DMA59_15225 [Salmonella enterica subsp. enterica serovar Potsdam]|uniref:Uncharacterized protein n=1 Tax=Salmonella potsdam TaxID=597 RepID=A0A5U6HKD5_SALPO|nr:hypothetical protein [Salmonella enterica subsp. enterica serovar Potsdam]